MRVFYNKWLRGAMDAVPGNGRQFHVQVGLVHPGVKGCAASSALVGGYGKQNVKLYNMIVSLKALNNDMKTIILASVSPRRRELLEQIGLKFKVEPSNYEEDLSSGLDPHELAKLLSLKKAELVAKNHRNAIVIAADTFVVFEGKILGKPQTETDARKMLTALSGKQHSVITGFTIIDTGSHKALSRSVATKVYIRKLTSNEIDAYVKSKEPLDKAGAYAIQGLGSVIVEKIEGDYSNVVGFPLSALAESLKEFGVHVL